MPVIMYNSKTRPAPAGSLKFAVLPTITLRAFLTSLIIDRDPIVCFLTSFREIGVISEGEPELLLPEFD